MKQIAIIFLCFVLLPYSGFSQVPAYLDTNGLVAFYNFNNSTTDGYIYQNHGYGIGLSSTSDRFASANGAFSFDGISSYIAVPGTTSLSEFPIGQTVSVWLKLDSLPSDNREHYILRKQHDFPFSFYHLFISDFANAEQLMYRYGNSSVNTAYGPTAYSNIPVNQWFHYLMTTDLAHTYCYINGVQVSDSLNDQNAMFGVNTDSLFIGTNMDGDPNRTKYQGAMDDLAIYNRYTDACEVKRMFNSVTYAVNDDTVNVMGSIILTINTIDTGQSFQWQVDDGTVFSNIVNNSTYNGATTINLTISNAAMAMNDFEYRCVVTDNGCVDTSVAGLLTVVDPSVIEAVVTKSNINVYPNPFADVIYVKSNEAIQDIEFSSIEGRSILKIRPNSQEVVLKSSMLPRGLYLIKVNGTHIVKLTK